MAVPFEKNALLEVARQSSHWLVSIAPGEAGDPALDILKKHAGQLLNAIWIGYLSSTNVYGNHDGGWVDEETETRPSLDRGKRRLTAEDGWHRLATDIGAALHIFRLAGIYGPGRNAVRSLLDGKAKRIIKPGQIFSRIHVADIAATVWAAMNSDLESRIFNLADDDPCAPQDVIAFAADLMGITPPPEIPFEDAEMSPMARSFYMESKRVRNDRIKSDLGIELTYPSFRKALPELVESEK